MNQIKVMAYKKKKLVFEAVKQDDGVFAVKTQPRKNGSWHTACECYCIDNRGNSMEMAQLIAKLLNENEMRGEIRIYEDNHYH